MREGPEERGGGPQLFDLERSPFDPFEVRDIVDNALIIPFAGWIGFPGYGKDTVLPLLAMRQQFHFQVLDFTRLGEAAAELGYRLLSGEKAVKADFQDLFLIIFKQLASGRIDIPEYQVFSRQEYGILRP